METQQALDKSLAARPVSADMHRDARVVVVVHNFGGIPEEFCFLGGFFGAFCCPLKQGSPRTEPEPETGFPETGANLQNRIWRQSWRKTPAAQKEICKASVLPQNLALIVAKPILHLGSGSISLWLFTACPLFTTIHLQSRSTAPLLKSGGSLTKGSLWWRTL